MARNRRPVPRARREAAPDRPGRGHAPGCRARHARRRPRGRDEGRRDRRRDARRRRSRRSPRRRRPSRRRSRGRAERGRRGGARVARARAPSSSSTQTFPASCRYDLRSLLAATPLGGIALVASRGRAHERPEPAGARISSTRSTGRTVPTGSSGPRGTSGSRRLRVAIPNLADDVDTREDLDRLRLRAGPHTQAALRGS